MYIFATIWRDETGCIPFSVNVPIHLPFAAVMEKDKYRRLVSPPPRKSYWQEKLPARLLASCLSFLACRDAAAALSVCHGWTLPTGIEEPLFRVWYARELPTCSQDDTSLWRCEQQGLLSWRQRLQDQRKHQPFATMLLDQCPIAAQFSGSANCILELLTFPRTAGPFRVRLTPGSATVYTVFLRWLTDWDRDVCAFDNTLMVDIGIAPSAAQRIASASKELDDDTSRRVSCLPSKSSRHLFFLLSSLLVPFDLDQRRRQIQIRMTRWCY
jgi:hypothetical protein